MAEYTMATKDEAWSSAVAFASGWTQDGVRGLGESSGGGGYFYAQRKRYNTYYTNTYRWDVGEPGIDREFFIDDSSGEIVITNEQGEVMQKDVFAPVVTQTDGEILWDEIQADLGGEENDVKALLAVLGSVGLLAFSGAISGTAILGAAALGLTIGSVYTYFKNNENILDYHNMAGNGFKFDMSSLDLDAGNFFDTVKTLTGFIPYDPLLKSASVLKNIGDILIEKYAVPAEEQDNFREDIKNVMSPAFDGANEFIPDRQGIKESYLNLGTFKTLLQNNLASLSPAYTGTAGALTPEIEAIPSLPDFINDYFDIVPPATIPGDLLNHPSYPDGKVYLGELGGVVYDPATDKAQVIKKGGVKNLEINIDVSGIIAALNPLSYLIHLLVMKDSMVTDTQTRIDTKTMLENKQMAADMTEVNRVAVIKLLKEYGYSVDGYGALVKTGTGVRDIEGAVSTLKEEEFNHTVDGKAKIERDGEGWANIHSTVTADTFGDSTGTSLNIPKGLLTGLLGAGAIELARELLISRANSNISAKAKGESIEEDITNESDPSLDLASLFMTYKAPEGLDLPEGFTVPSDLQKLLDMWNSGKFIDKDGTEVK